MKKMLWRLGATNITSVVILNGYIYHKFYDNKSLDNALKIHTLNSLGICYLSFIPGNMLF